VKQIARAATYEFILPPTVLACHFLKARSYRNFPIKKQSLIFRPLATPSTFTFISPALIFGFRIKQSLICVGRNVNVMSK